MRDQLPTVRGTRPGTAPSFPERPYVYNGDEPWVPPKPRANLSPCAVAECSEPASARSYCSRHYRRFMKHGTPDAPDQRRKENQ